jgi:tetrahydromethanopterin S-methyltransferase subunit G
MGVSESVIKLITILFFIIVCKKMAESLASLFASGTETYMLQRMSELEKKMDAVNADYLQLSWRLCETLNENTKLSARIADLEAMVDVVDTEYVQVHSDRWLNVKDTKKLQVSQSLADRLRPHMLCKLINLETLVISDLAKPAELEIYANKNVTRIDMYGSKMPNLENFPSCRTLHFSICGCGELKVSIVVSTLSTHRHNITTVMVSTDGHGKFLEDLKILENYCKNSGIAWVRSNK